MFDSEQRLVVCNKAYADIYFLPSGLTCPGTPFVDILRYHLRRVTGEETSGEAAREWIADHVARLHQPGPLEDIQSLTDGRVIRVTYQPLAGGGTSSTLPTARAAGSAATARRRGPSIWGKTD